MLFHGLFALVVVFSSVLAHPTADPINELRIVGRTQSAKINTDDFDVLVQGNQEFRVAQADLIRQLSDEGQKPKFLFLGCSDSRVSEGTVFNAKVGTFFAERNIANLFEKPDNNVKAIISYGVEHLHVKHIIVMGHYGCGGVQASIASPPPKPWDEATEAIQTWIKPIRKLYKTSKRSEIVALRTRNEGNSTVAGPPNDDPGFRALVEENVKNTVKNLACDKVIKEHYANPESATHELYIHGWVYDIANGEVRDLDVSVGPPGKPIPTAPFTAVARAASSDDL